VLERRAPDRPNLHNEADEPHNEWAGNSQLSDVRPSPDESRTQNIQISRHQQLDHFGICFTIAKANQFNLFVDTLHLPNFPIRSLSLFLEFLLLCSLNSVHSSSPALILFVHTPIEALEVEQMSLFATNFALIALINYNSTISVCSTSFETVKARQTLHIIIEPIIAVESRLCYLPKYPGEREEAKNNYVSTL
jgi:hypothetical protein